MPNKTVVRGILLLGLNCLCAHIAALPTAVANPTDQFDSILRDAAHGMLQSDLSIVTPDPIQHLSDLDKFSDYQRKLYLL